LGAAKCLTVQSCIRIIAGNTRFLSFEVEYHIVETIIVDILDMTIVGG
jgi:hypothetical protein